MLVTNTKGTYGTNVVDKNTLNKYQRSVLGCLNEILSESFGPYGSNTCIKQGDSLNMYTKDGYTILCNVKFTGIIEESIRSDIETIVTNVVTTVGDGTTSAVILSDHLFSALSDFEKDSDVTPYEIIETMNEVVAAVCAGIKDSARPATAEDIFDIALISANNNREIATVIASIYEKFGMDVFIDVAMSPAKETMIKYFDGMTLNTGYSDTCFVNTKDNKCSLRNPSIYFFEDPIDTMDMGVLFNSIINHNILAPYNAGNDEAVIPTVVIAPKISRDMASYLDKITDFQSRLNPADRLPLLVISDTHQVSELMDICKMCGTNTIHKYIDAELYKKDVEAGLAPTRENVHEWAGHAEEVVADSVKTKFINPINKVQDENGEYPEVYKSLLGFLTSSLEEAIANGDDAHTIGTLRRRINSLKSNLVEIHVGGMTMADRDSARHLMEDAVKNCRSAAANGVGWGSNYSAYKEIHRMCKEERKGDSAWMYNMMLDIVREAYDCLMDDLYYVSRFSGTKPEDSLEKGCPLNLRNGEYDGKVKSSIESDIVILQSVSKIIGIMVTCNQFLTPNPQMNVYSDLMEV